MNRASIFTALSLAFATALGAGCTAYETDAQVAQGLTVCHTTTVEGVDVSEFQGTIDWNAVHASGRAFAIARSSDGTYHDATFARNWAGMRAAGMVRGAYHFWRPTIAANTQADVIQSLVGRLGPGDLPFMIDVECMCSSSAGTCVSSGPGCVAPAAAAANLRALVARVATDTGKTPIIYTGSWFWDGGSYLHDAITLPSNPLVVSGYTTGCVTVPAGWTDWHIWQYSDGTCTGCPVRCTTIPGFSNPPNNGCPSGSSVDRDKFNGTLADLTAFANGDGSATWGAQFVMQSFPYAAVGAVNVVTGGTASLSITLKNTGTHAWDQNTCIGTTGPRDRASALAGPEWRGPNRPACVAAGMTVATNANYTFTFLVHGPATPGHFDEHWGVVEEGTAWFSDPGEGGPPDDDLEGIIDVTAGDGGVVDDAAAAGDAMPDTDGASPSDAGASDTGLSGSDAATRSDAGSDGGTSGDHGGCGCRTPATSGARGGVLGWLALAAASGAVRRRRPRRG